MRKFQEYLLSNELILERLSNIDDLRESLWKAFIKANESLYINLLTQYQVAESRRKEIEKEAMSERTRWEKVIEIFNQRFFVPFELFIKNREAVIIGQETIANLGFKFKDDSDEMDVTKSNLIDVLSMGEKKALYILNVLFDIETRKNDSHSEVLIIIDDLADSFDYKNKYAIIQYLIDISKIQTFKQIILTHNFDFFRTVGSRFRGRSKSFMVSKSSSGLSLSSAEGIQNIFIKKWKGEYCTDIRKKIACITFMRNLVEYTQGTSHPSYLTLTSLLHWKKETPEIKVSQLDEIYSQLFLKETHSANSNLAVVDLIFLEAKNCLDADEGINLENKIILAIATRLKIEKYMLSKISDEDFINSLDSSQTIQLSNKYNELHSEDYRVIDIIEQVILMTPENIHLNSFMYEPLLDMSDLYLRELYKKVNSLQEE